MKFCRINLSKTNYQCYSPSTLWSEQIEFAQLNQIYQQYCQHKKFVSAMPIFEGQLRNPDSDVHVYYHNSEIVAWSLCCRYDKHNVESVQFAWNYQQPELKLGLRSIEHECAYYKQLGYHYLYLGNVAEYKTQFDGYEQLGIL